MKAALPHPYTEQRCETEYRYVFRANLVDHYSVDRSEKSSARIPHLTEARQAIKMLKAATLLISDGFSY